MGAQQSGNITPIMAKSNDFSFTQPFGNYILRLYLLSVVYRNLILKKKTLILISKILTHAILLPFHIKNLNQSNGHELIEKKMVRCFIFPIVRVTRRIRRPSRPADESTIHWGVNVLWRRHYTCQAKSALV